MRVVTEIVRLGFSNSSRRLRVLTAVLVIALGAAAVGRRHGVGPPR